MEPPNANEKVTQKARNDERTRDNQSPTKGKAWDQGIGRSISRLPRIVRSPSKFYRSVRLTTSTPKCLGAALDNSGDTSNKSVHKMKPKRDDILNKLKPSHIPRRKSFKDEMRNYFNQRTENTACGTSNYIPEDRNVQSINLMINPDFSCREPNEQTSSLVSSRPIPTLGQIYGHADIIDNDRFNDWFMELNGSTPMTEFASNTMSFDFEDGDTSNGSPELYRSNLTSPNSTRQSLERSTVVMCNPGKSKSSIRRTNGSAAIYLGSELELPTRDNESSSGYRSLSPDSKYSNKYTDSQQDGLKVKAEDNFYNNIELTSTEDSETTSVLRDKETVVLCKSPDSVKEDLDDIYSLDTKNPGSDEMKNSAVLKNSDQKDSLRSSAPSYTECLSEILQKTTNFENVDVFDPIQSTPSSACSDLGIPDNLSNRYAEAIDDLGMTNEHPNMDWIHEDGPQSKESLIFNKTESTDTEQCRVDHSNYVHKLGHNRKPRCYPRYYKDNNQVHRNTVRRYQNYKDLPSNRYNLPNSFRRWPRRGLIQRVSRRRWNFLWKKTTKRWAKLSFKQPIKTRHLHVMQYLQHSAIWEDVNLQTTILCYQETGTDSALNEKRSAGIMAVSGHAVETVDTGCDTPFYNARSKSIDVGPSMFPYQSSPSQRRSVPLTSFRKTEDHRSWSHFPSKKIKTNSSQFQWNANYTISEANETRSSQNDERTSLPITPRRKAEDLRSYSQFSRKKIKTNSCGFQSNINYSVSDANETRSCQYDAVIPEDVETSTSSIMQLVGENKMSDQYADTDELPVSLNENVVNSFMNSSPTRVPPVHSIQTYTQPTTCKSAATEVADDTTRTALSNAMTETTSIETSNITFYKPIMAKEISHLVPTPLTKPRHLSMFCMMHNNMMKTAATSPVQSHEKLRNVPCATSTLRTLQDSIEKVSLSVTTSRHTFSEMTTSIVSESATRLDLLETECQTDKEEQNPWDQPGPSTVKQLAFEEICCQTLMNNTDSFTDVSVMDEKVTRDTSTDGIYMVAVVTSMPSLENKISNYVSDCMLLDSVSKESYSIQTQPQLPKLIMTGPKILSISSKNLTEKCISSSDIERSPPKELVHTYTATHRSVPVTNSRLRTVSNLLIPVITCEAFTCTKDNVCAATVSTIEHRPSLSCDTDFSLNYPENQTFVEDSTQMSSNFIDVHDVSVSIIYPTYKTTTTNTSAELVSKSIQAWPSSPVISPKITPEKIRSTIATEQQYKETVASAGENNPSYISSTANHSQFISTCLLTQSWVASSVQTEDVTVNGLPSQHRNLRSASVMTSHPTITASVQVHTYSAKPSEERVVNVCACVPPVCQDNTTATDTLFLQNLDRPAQTSMLELCKSVAVSCDPVLKSLSSWTCPGASLNSQLLSLSRMIGHRRRTSSFMGGTIASSIMSSELNADKWMKTCTSMDKRFAYQTLVDPPAEFTPSSSRTISSMLPRKSPTVPRQVKSFMSNDSLADVLPMEKSKENINNSKQNLLIPNKIWVPMEQPIPIDLQAMPLDMNPSTIEEYSIPVDVQPSPINLQSNPIDVQVIPIDVQPSTINTQPSAINAQPSPINAKLISVAANPNPIDMHSSLKDVQRSPINVQSCTINVQPSQVDTQPSPIHAISIPIDAQRSSVHAQPSPIHAQPISMVVQPSQINMQPNPKEVQRSTIYVQPSPIDTQLSPIHGQPSPVDAKPNSIVVQPSQIDMQPNPIDVQHSTINVQPSRIDAQPSPIYAQPRPIHAQPCPTEILPSPIDMQRSPINVRSCTIDTQPSPIDTQPSQLRIYGDTQLIPMDAQPSPIHMLPSPINVQRSPTNMQSFTINLQPTPIHAESSLKDVIPSAINAQPSTINVQPNSIYTQPSSIDTQSISRDTQPSSIDVERTSVDAQRSPINMQRSPINVQSCRIDEQPNPTDVQPCTLDERATPTYVEPSLIIGNPSTIDEQPSTINVQPSPINVQPLPTDVQPCTIDVQQNPTDVLPSPINVQPSPINVQPSPINVQQSPINVQKSLINTQSSAILMQSNLIDVKQNPMGVPPPSNVITSSCLLPTASPCVCGELFENDTNACTPNTTTEDVQEESKNSSTMSTTNQNQDIVVKNSSIVNTTTLQEESKKSSTKSITSQKQDIAVKKCSIVNTLQEESEKSSTKSITSHKQDSPVKHSSIITSQARIKSQDSTPTKVILSAQSSRGLISEMQGKISVQSSQGGDDEPAPEQQRKMIHNMVYTETSATLLAKNFNESTLQASPSLSEMGTEPSRLSRHRSVCVFTSRCILPSCKTCNYARNAQRQTDSNCMYIFGEPVCAIHRPCFNNEVQTSDSTREVVNIGVNNTRHEIRGRTDVGVLTPFFGMIPESFKKSSNVILSPKVYKALYETTKMIVNEDTKQPPVKEVRSPATSTARTTAPTSLPTQSSASVPAQGFTMKPSWTLSQTSAPSQTRTPANAQPLAPKPNQIPSQALCPTPTRPEIPSLAPAPIPASPQPPAPLAPQSEPEPAKPNSDTPAEPVQDPPKPPVTYTDAEVEVWKSCMLDMKSAGVVTSTGQYMCSPEKCSCNGRHSHTPHQRIQECTLFHAEALIDSSQRANTENVFHAKLLDLSQEAFDTEDKNNNENEKDRDQKEGAFEEHFKTNLVTSCRYYSSLLTRRLEKVKNNWTKNMKNDDELEPRRSAHSFGTMKPSGRADLSCQTAHTKAFFLRQNITNIRDPLSSCTLPPTASMTDICRNDKIHLNSMYNVMSAVEGRLRRLKITPPP